MSFTPIFYHLKSGAEILIREAEESDADNLIELCKSYIKNTTSIPLYEDEYDPTTEFIENMIKTFIEEKNSILLLATHNNKLIGNVDLHGNQRRKLFHTGWIGMAIEESWRGKGVGTFLMEELINWSKGNEYVKVLWLQAYLNNKAGIGLYEKMGFIETGIQKGMYQEANGELIDSIMMTKYL